MSEMVERVARAICLAELPTDSKWELCVPAARAAIEAMKPTTNRMDVAGVTYLRENHSDASGCFESMIGAALKD